MASTTPDTQQSSAAQNPRLSGRTQTQAGHFARFKACVDACATTTPQQDILWCIADCDVTLRSSLTTQPPGAAADPITSLGTAALLLPFVSQPSQPAVGANGGTQSLVDRIATEFQLNETQSAKLKTILATHGAVSIATPDTPVDIPESRQKPGAWQRIVAAVKRIPAVIPELDKIGDFVRKYAKDAHTLWTVSLPVVITFLATLAGVFRTFAAGNQQANPGDGGIGGGVEGSAADWVTIALIAFTIVATATLVLSRPVREYLIAKRVGNLILVALYLVFAAALVSAVT